MKRFNTFGHVAVASLSFALTVMSGGVANANPVITDGLVAAYPFNGNADDWSGNGNNGVVNGATLTADRFGNPNSAYSFAAAHARVEVPPIFSSHQSQLTYVAWINLPQLGGTIYGEFTSGGNTRNTWMARTGWDVNGALTLNTFPPSGAADGHVGVDLVERRSEWVQTAIVRDGNLISGYLNGAFVGSVSVTGSYGGSPSTLAAIGNRYNSVAGGWYGNQVGSYKFDGAVDDFYAYDRALSATEVQALFTAVPEPSTSLLFTLGLIGISASSRRGASR